MDRFKQSTNNGRIEYHYKKGALLYTLLSCCCLPIGMWVFEGVVLWLAGTKCRCCCCCCSIDRIGSDSREREGATWHRAATAAQCHWAPPAAVAVGPVVVVEVVEAVREGR